MSAKRIRFLMDSIHFFLSWISLSTLFLFKPISSRDYSMPLGHHVAVSQAIFNRTLNKAYTLILTSTPKCVVEEGMTVSQEYWITFPSLHCTSETWNHNLLKWSRAWIVPTFWIRLWRRENTTNTGVLFMGKVRSHEITSICTLIYKLTLTKCVGRVYYTHV